MKVLFIGYSKCGTKSMNAAFKILGYNCYDILENFGFLGNEWREILNNGATKEIFQRMYKDVDACVDIPAYPFWEEILEAFPDTKLIVAYREEEAWLKSFEKQMRTIYSNKISHILALLSPTYWHMMQTCRLFSYHLWGSDRNGWPWQTFTGINYTLMRHRYRQHNLNIQQKAPKDQLLVVDLKAGWEPICEFLGKPVPDVPFPHSNKGQTILGEFIKTHPIFKKIKREAIISTSVLIVLLSVGSFYFFRFLYGKN